MPGPSSWWHPSTSNGRLDAVVAADNSRSGKQRRLALTETVGWSGRQSKTLEWSYDTIVLTVSVIQIRFT